MRNLFVVLVCSLMLHLANCQYFRYPSGVQVWVQKVEVIEVNERGEEITYNGVAVHPVNRDEEQLPNSITEDFPDIDERFGELTVTEVPNDDRKGKQHVWIFNNDVKEVSYGTK